MNPMQSPNTGVGGEDHGLAKKESAFLTTQEAAELLGIKPQSLRVRNVRGKGPFPVLTDRGCYQNLFLLTDVEHSLLTDKKDAS